MSIICKVSVAWILPKIKTIKKEDNFLFMGGYQRREMHPVVCADVAGKPKCLFNLAVAGLFIAVAASVEPATSKRVELLRTDNMLRRCFL